MALAAIPYLIDTNVLIGAYDANDVHYNAACQTMTDLVAAQGTGIVLDHVIQEVLTVFLYRAANAQAMNFMSELQSDPSMLGVECPLHWIQDAIELAQKQQFRPKVSLTDWLLLSRSIATGTPILTFDNQLLAASKKLC